MTEMKHFGWTHNDHYGCFEMFLAFWWVVHRLETQRAVVENVPEMLIRKV